MGLTKFKSGRLELVVCILGPILVLAAIMIPGVIRCRTIKRDLMERQARLDQVPNMEGQLAEARKVMLPLTVKSAEDDKAADLTLIVDEAASRYGFTTRSVNVDKQPGTETWTDYRIVVSGTGPLKSIVAMLDFMEHPAQRFRVTSVTLRPKGLNGSAIYDGDMTLAFRSIILSPASGSGLSSEPVTPASAEQQVGRLRQLTDALKAWSAEKRPPLVITDVEKPKESGKTDQPRAARLFALTGIVQDKKNPLALTDRGVFGLGDRVDGYEIVAIATDHVVVLGANGRTETVKLYTDDPR